MKADAQTRRHNFLGRIIFINVDCFETHNRHMYTELILVGGSESSINPQLRTCTYASQIKVGKRGENRRAVMRRMRRTVLRSALRICIDQLQGATFHLHLELILTESSILKNSRTVLKAILEEFQKVQYNFEDFLEDLRMYESILGSQKES